MKKFIEIILGLGFLVSFIFICGAVESNKWGWAFIFLCIFGFILCVGNEFVSKNKERKEIYFKETIPQGFLENVMAALIEEHNSDKVFTFVQDELEVKNVYFAGRTLCIDVEDIDTDNEWKGVITITSPGTCGWFNPDGYSKDVHVKRDKLTQIEEDMYKELCKLNNINFENKEEK